MGHNDKICRSPHAKRVVPVYAAFRGEVAG